MKDLIGGENDRNKAEQGVHDLAGNSPAEAPRAQQSPPTHPSKQAILAAHKVYDAIFDHQRSDMRMTITILAEHFQSAIDAAVAADRREAAEHYRKEQEELHKTIDVILGKKK